VKNRPEVVAGHLLTKEPNLLAICANLLYATMVTLAPADDDIPDFDDDPATVTTPAMQQAAYLRDAHGHAYEPGCRVRNFHNGTEGVALRSELMTVLVWYDGATEPTQCDPRRQVEVMVGAKRLDIAQMLEEVAQREAEERKAIQSDLAAAAQEQAEIAQELSDADGDGLDDEESDEEESDEEDDAEESMDDGEWATVDGEHRRVFVFEDPPGPLEELGPQHDLSTHGEEERAERSAFDQSAAPVAELMMADESSYNIYCGDGPSGLLGLDEVDHVFVDVPYSKATDDGNEADNTRDNSFGFEPMTPDLMERTAQAIGARCRRWCLLMTSDDEVHPWCEALKRAGMFIYRIGHWVREGTKPQMDGTGPAQAVEYIIIAHSRFGTQRWNGGGKRALWFAPIVSKEQRRHPTQKPAKLLKQLFEDFTDPGELIADVMAGSFESGIVAVSMGRRYEGWDIDAKHVDMARELFKLPLIHRTPLQASLFNEPRASTRVATARAEMDREIFRAIQASPGIKVIEIMQRVGASERSEVTRSLGRMRKKQLVRQEGKTSNATYFPLTLKERQEIDETKARDFSSQQTPNEAG